MATTAQSTPARTPRPTLQVMLEAVPSQPLVLGQKTWERSRTCRRFQTARLQVHSAQRASGPMLPAPGTGCMLQAPCRARKPKGRHPMTTPDISSASPARQSLTETDPAGSIPALPPLAIFAEPAPSSASPAGQLERQGAALMQCLQELDLRATLLRTAEGPLLATFLLRPAPGVPGRAASSARPTRLPLPSTQAQSLSRRRCPAPTPSASSCRASAAMP